MGVNVAISAPPLLPLDLRLRSLESQILGVPPSISSPAPTIDVKKWSITRRLRDLQDGLERLTGDSEGLKRLLAGYQQYSPLLRLPTESAPSPSKEGDTRGPAELDFLPDPTKVAMLLEAGADIRGAERVLREIEMLRARGVEGSGTLEELLPHRGNLMKGVKSAKERSKEVERTRKEVSDLLIRYTEFTSTVSELFVALHRRMEGLEEDVARVERSRRKEVAGRF